MNKILTMEDLDDFVRGSTLFGTGGGGPQNVGKSLLLGSFEEGKNLEFVDINDLDDEAWICTALFMGSIAPLSDEEKEKKASLGLDEKKEPRVLVRAVKELEKELGIEFDGIVSVELGGINCPAPLDAAAQLNKKFIDADLAGRAVPEVAQILPRMMKYEIAPIACVDPWGDVCIIKEVANYDMAEQLGKMLSIPAFEPIGLACFPMKVKDAKEAMVTETMTRNLKAGAAVREARENGEDPVKAFADIADGQIVFRGTVEKKEWKNEGGYMYVDLDLKGIKEFENNTFRIWAKNENHISWLNDEVYITSPDLLQCVLEDGEPLTNTDIKEGDYVAVVAFANPKYRTEEGIRIMGPKHYGFDIEYRPMEEII